MPDLVLRWPMRLLLGVGALALPLWRWWLGRRLRKGKEHALSVSQKLLTHLDRPNPPLPRSGLLVWGHAVSVGEVLALLGLFRRLSCDFPQVQFLLTSSTITSGQALAKQDLPAQIQHQYAPLDHPELVKRFLSHWKPGLALWLQSDLWPHTVLATHAKGIPMLMLNARMSKAKVARRRRYAWFYEPLLNSYAEIFAQNEDYRDNLLMLGNHMPISKLVGNVKALAPPLPVSQSSKREFEEAVANRPIWVLASSHDGEEKIAMQAHQLVLKSRPEALLIIVPRHVAKSEKWLAVAQQMNLEASLRSKIGQPPTRVSVYIADTIGEMGLWYALARVALVGGSLVPHGGHNPYEASAAGCLVLHGPYVKSCQESYDDLAARGLARLVMNEQELAQSVLEYVDRALFPKGLSSGSVLHPDDPLYERIKGYIREAASARG